MIIGQSPSSQSIGQATATIKTDGGYQTVPVILQHGNSNQVGNIQIQKQIGGIGQQIIQPVVRLLCPYHYYFSLIQFNIIIQNMFLF